MTNANDLINETRYKVDETASESYPNHGLTKREYFAAMAMQGIIAAQRICETGIDHETNAEASVKASDALINALNETK